MKLKNMIDYEVPENKKVRVIIDTDAACEADDPFAIVHALLSPKLEVKAILAEQFGESDSTKRSYEEIKTIIKLLELDIPCCMGEAKTVDEIDFNHISEASEFIISEAMKNEKTDLYMLCMGALTNLAVAIRKNPSIIKRMTVIWIGGQDYNHLNPNYREFNSGNDVAAANIVLHSGINIWQIPFGVYSKMHISFAEIRRSIYPYGKIGKHLFDNLVKFNKSEIAYWSSGESWSLGDSPSVGVVLDPNCGTYIYRKAPMINEDTTYTVNEDATLIRVYETVNSRYIIEDMKCKIQLHSEK